MMQVVTNRWLIKGLYISAYKNISSGWNAALEREAGVENTLEFGYDPYPEDLKDDTPPSSATILALLADLDKRISSPDMYFHPTRIITGDEAVGYYRDVKKTVEEWIESK